jgi:CheY-like chemotaxis protein
LGRLILIAEDNETNRTVILRQLGLIGIAADVAADGIAALKCWRTGDYTLVLTDLHMPLMDGYALAASIRADEAPGRRTPIVALTANAARDEELRCRAVGMDGYLSKPVRLVQLKTMIEGWLGSPGQRRVEQRRPLTAGTAPLVVDLSVLVALVGDDPAEIDAVLRAFQASASQSAEELDKGVACGSMKSIADAAHNFKSAARSIGALRLGEICAEIEHVAVTQRATSLSALVQRFHAELAAVRNFIESR